MIRRITHQNDLSAHFSDPDLPNATALWNTVLKEKQSDYNQIRERFDRFYRLIPTAGLILLAIERGISRREIPMETSSSGVHKGYNKSQILAARRTRLNLMEIIPHYKQPLPTPETVSVGDEFLSRCNEIVGRMVWFSCEDLSKSSDCCKDMKLLTSHEHCKEGLIYLFVHLIKGQYSEKERLLLDRMGQKIENMTRANFSDAIMQFFQFS